MVWLLILSAKDRGRMGFWNVCLGGLFDLVDSQPGTVVFAPRLPLCDELGVLFLK